jgi:hypothetical protein
MYYAHINQPTFPTEWCYSGVFATRYCRLIQPPSIRKNGGPE